MGNPALDRSKNMELDESLVDAVGSKEKTAKEAQQLMALKDQVRKKIDTAGDVFTKEDKDRWGRKLEQADITSESDLKTLSTEITKEANQIKAQISEYSKRVRSKEKLFGKGTATAYIKEFKEQPFEKKMEWFEKLDDELHGLQELYDEAKATLTKPEFERFKGLRRHQKRNLLDEIRESKKKIENYTAVLKQNKAVFGKDEIAKLEADFKDMTADKQAEANRNLYIEEIQPRQKLAQTFKEFPDSFRRRYSKFAETDIQGKQEIIEQMTTQLDHDYQRKLFAAPISIESKQSSLSWFARATISMKGEALLALDKQVGEEDKINNDFERCMDEYYKLQEVGEERPALARDFYNSQYEQKVQSLMELKNMIFTKKAEKAETAKLAKDYAALLKAEVGKKVISQKTMGRYIEKFQTHTLEEKRHATSDTTFNAEMSHRRALLERFNKELPDAVKKQHGEAFYGTGYHGRMVKFQALQKMYEKEIAALKKKNDAKEKKTEAANDNAKKAPDARTKLKDMKHEAMMLQLEGKEKEALKLYEEMLKLAGNNGITDTFSKKQTETLRIKLGKVKPANDNAKSPTTRDVNEAIKKHLKDSAIRKQSKDATLIKKAVDVVSKSDRETQTIDAEKKTRGLSSTQHKIQEKLVKKHGKVLQEDKAVDITEVDVNKGFQETDSTNAVKLAEAVGGAEDRIKAGKSVDNVQLVSEGNKLSGLAGRQRAIKLERKAKTDLRKKVVKDLEQRGHGVDAIKLQEIKKVVKKNKKVTNFDLMEAA
ncbi:hypothetical protein ACFL2V_13560 [Pseudomonadota bacterium]